MKHAEFVLFMLKNAYYTYKSALVELSAPTQSEIASELFSFADHFDSLSYKAKVGNLHGYFTYSIQMANGGTA